MSETRLFIGNIPLNTSESDLQSEFSYYGKVKSVELKTKNEDTLYGFVNIEIDEKLIQKCIREFSQQKFKGNYLSVSKAKESFLDRLKREREQKEKIGDDSSIGRRLIEMSMKSNTELEEKSKLPQIQKEVSSSEESSSEEEVTIQPIKKVNYIKDQPVYPTTINYTAKEEPKVLDKAALDDQKRQQSLQKLKDMHRDKKNAIRNALQSIDTTAPRNNKIVFEKPEPMAESTQKPVLFDDDEEMEVVADSFKLKKQFEGKKGEKLFELQTKFHNDSRFKMDERFVDETSDNFVDSRKKYAREELKERKRMRKEMANWDQDDMKEERDHQLSILESITGQSTGFNNTQKPPQKGMLRFDPSNKSHQKYLDVVRGDEELDSDNDQAENTKSYENVGDEMYFEVSDNLANAFKSNESNSQPFSIFGMLGINHNDVDNGEKVEEIPEAKTIKLPTKIQAIQMNQARFKYDSSDTDEEAEKEKSKKKEVSSNKKSRDGKYTKTGVWRYNFFVCDGDKRLQDAFAFLKKSIFVEPEALQEKRKKLKKVIKTQVRKAKHDKEKSLKKRKV